MDSYYIAYGHRDKVSSAIGSGIIPPGTIIFTDDSTEILFYDLQKNLKSFKEKYKFGSLKEAQNWVSKYDCKGQIISVHEDDKCNAYVVNYGKQLEPITASANVSTGDGMGLWQPNKQYNVGDIVYKPRMDDGWNPYDEIYICIVSHTSEDFTFDLEGNSYWEYVKSVEASYAVTAECDANGNVIHETYETNGPKEVINFGNDLSLESREDGIYLVDENTGGSIILYSGGTGSYVENADSAYNATYATEATIAFEDYLERPLKGCSTYDGGDEESVDIYLVDGHIESYGVVSTSLTALVDEDEIVLGYMSGLHFTTPSEMPDDYSYFSDKIYFRGEDVVDGRFVPEANTRYSIVVFCDGNLLVGCVLGVPAPPVEPEEEVIE